VVTIACLSCGAMAEVVRTGPQTAHLTFDLSPFLRLCKEAQARLVAGQSLGEGWGCPALPQAYEEAVAEGRV
jgi:hypothetical protein